MSVNSEHVELIVSAQTSIVRRILEECHRAEDLSKIGTIGKTPRNALSSNIESGSILNEEIFEAMQEAMSLYRSLEKLTKSGTHMMRSINDIESLEFRNSLGNECQLDMEALSYMRVKLEEELVQVAAVTVNWLLRLELQRNAAKRG